MQYHLLYNMILATQTLFSKNNTTSLVAQTWKTIFVSFQKCSKQKKFVCLFHFYLFFGYSEFNTRKTKQKHPFKKYFGHSRCTKSYDICCFREFVPLGPRNKSHKSVKRAKMEIKVFFVMPTVWSWATFGPLWKYFEGYGKIQPGKRWWGLNGFESN